MPEELPALESVYKSPPVSSEQLLPITAEQQLYNTYASRADSLPGFRQRAFEEARDDFVATVHETQSTFSVDQLAGIVKRIIEEDSYNSFKSDFTKYWQDNNLEQDLHNYSYCVLTNHRFFSDLPVCTMAVYDMRRDDPMAKERNLLVVGRLIPTMEVDLFKSGDFVPVTPVLANGARQIQTVPKLPSNATDEMKALRKIWNHDSKHALETAATTPGNIILMAASGSQDLIKGDKLVMQHINPETARLIRSPRLKVLPIFFSCNSFSPDGLEPAPAKYKFLKPRVFETPEQVRDTMIELASVGAELLVDEFPSGVEYALSYRERTAKRLGGSALRKGR